MDWQTANVPHQQPFTMNYLKFLTILLYLMKKAAYRKRVCKLFNFSLELLEIISIFLVLQFDKFQISWLFMTFGTCPGHLMASRLLSGFVNGGAQTCIFLFVAEIADNE